METRANYVAVGVFVLGAILALVVAVLWLAGAQFRNEYALYQTSFPGPVTGLGAGGTVRYNGIDVGSVRDVSFDPRDPRRVIAVLQVQPNLPIRRDSAASLESQGLTGVTYVEISGGTPTAPLLTREPGQEYPVLMSRPSTFQRLYESTPRLLERLNTLTDRGTDILNDENRQAFADILRNLRDVTAAVNSHTADIDRVLANLDDITDRASQTFASADKAAKSADAAAQDVSTLVRDTDEVVRTGAIAEMNRLVGDARALIASLTRLSNELERQPTQLLFGDRRQGYTPR
jgi:phospholipid/cholesterol/gamma-HCH transport system substrate-binding protein